RLVRLPRFAFLRNSESVLGYLNAAHPSLKHQKADSLPEDSDIHRYRRRGLIGSVAKGYRKGACQNCGAISHQAKDCVERPRKRGAALTNKNICPDEVIIWIFVLFFINIASKFFIACFLVRFPNFVVAHAYSYF
ncbi:hypothetical protein BVRB_031440, partial [Beta vulgaris subsp. vulgaris]